MNSEELVLEYNRRGVLLLTRSLFSQAFQTFNSALHALELVHETSEKSRLLLITYNNLSCYYKKTNQNKKALQYLFKAADLEGDPSNIANVHLNISSILSDQAQHERALRHALKAVYLLRNNFQGEEEHVKQLILAYKTLSTQYQLLGMNSESQDCCLRAYNLGVENLGKSHPFTKSLTKQLSPPKNIHLRPEINNFTLRNKNKKNNTPGLAKKEDGISLQAWWKGETTGPIENLNSRIRTARYKLTRAKLKLNRLQNKRQKILSSSL